MSRIRSVSITVLVALLVVVAGCSSRQPGNTSPTPTASGTPTDAGTRTADAPTSATTTDGGTDPTRTATPRTPRPDPSGDRLGFERGFWYDDPVSVTAEDGYNRSEVDRVVARTMARLERIRDREFVDNVSVEIIDRQEYRKRNVFEFTPEPARDQLWEALFAVGEDADAATALNEVYGGSVAGYYSGGKIVLVSEDPSSVTLSRATLAHELTHALQDQHFGLGSGGATTKDGLLAARGISEGEANYVMDQYQQRCDTAWSCVPEVTPSGGSSDRNQAVFLSVYLPYSDGPTLVGDLYDRGGWSAVAAAWKDRPTSTEQVIHPEKYPDERPVEVSVADRSRDGWSRIGRGDTIGEATVFGAFVHNGVVPEDHLTTDDRRYNYSHPITAGWGGDRFVAYRNGDRFGYVFETAWDTPADAREFLDGYRDLLRENGAKKVRDGVYRIPESNAFGDAFRVVRDGRRVRVVNAPTVDELDDVHQPN